MYVRIFTEESIGQINETPGDQIPEIDGSNLEPYIRMFGVEDTARALINSDNEIAKSVMNKHGQDWNVVKNMQNTVGVIAAELQPVEVEDKKDHEEPSIQQNQTAGIIVNKNA